MSETACEVFSSCGPFVGKLNSMWSECAISKNIAVNFDGIASCQTRGPKYKTSSPKMKTMINFNFLSTEI